MKYEDCNPLAPDYLSIHIIYLEAWHTRHQADYQNKMLIKITKSTEFKNYLTG